mmetsp:Transcript_27286/g.41063  ORF Transcript_27286/g.41063 Transcript_27286/m.41063 type:complete len:145 (-) Transcript_27286:75-509(-)
MLSANIYKLLCVLLVVGSSFTKGIFHDSGFLDQIDRWNLDCPSVDDYIAENGNYTYECVDSSIPPYPLCLLHSVEYFIESAIASSDRCCDFSDLSECKCPIKESWWWKMKMGSWCEDIASCPATEGGGGYSAMETEVWTKFIGK